MGTPSKWYKIYSDHVTGKDKLREKENEIAKFPLKKKTRHFNFADPQIVMVLDKILQGDCQEVMKRFPDNHFDSIITDPPYELAFMGKRWDASGIAYNVDLWRECLRVLKPGGHLLAFGGTRTYHRMACAIEDAGFEIRDSIHWCYGSGFPKSLDVSKALDKMAGAEREITGTKTTAYDNSIRNAALKDNHNGLKIGNAGCKFNGFGAPITAPATPAAKQWAGWGSALKPAHEIIVLARKPLEEKTIAANVLRWGCGALNIDGCRVGFANHADEQEAKAKNQHGDFDSGQRKNKVYGEDLNSRTNYNAPGRFPANLIHDGSPEVLAQFPLSSITGNRKNKDRIQQKVVNTPFTRSQDAPEYTDSGSAARFFQSCQFTEDDIPAFVYYAKASRSERNGFAGLPGRSMQEICINKHPTVKPLSLMRYLCRLITPPGGLILDPFAGSGTTCMAAKAEGFHYMGIEREAEYCDIARKRISAIPEPLTTFQ